MTIVAALMTALYHATRRTGAGSPTVPATGPATYHAETSALHHYVPDLHRRMLLLPCGTPTSVLTKR